MDARGGSQVNDQYIVIRGLSERENGRWYNISRMNRAQEYRKARRGSTRTSTIPEEQVTCVSTTLEATGVLEFGTYGGVAEVYRPV